MPIVDIRPPKRQLVAFLNSEPPEEAKAAFVSRELAVARCTAEQLQDDAYLSGVAAVIFTQRAAKLSAVRDEVVAHAARLLDFDSRVIVRATTQGEEMVSSALRASRLPTAGLPRTTTRPLVPSDGDPVLPHIRLFGEAVPWQDIANYVLVRPPADPPNRALTIVVERGPQLDAAAELLIQRAFADCAEVHLRPMDEGRSGVAVYVAYADGGGLLGRWLTPHFVKVGDRSRVLSEYENYVGRVAPYLPFHLGPHLALDRCCLGATKGIIVGDFVDESESLLACASDGRAAAAIACLFDRTLRGWHRETKRGLGPLRDTLKLPQRIASTRIARARELGATLSLDEIRALFAQFPDTSPALEGPIHGDLHADNVRVRATDAIVIDFLQANEGPVLADAASLESSLLVTGFASDARDAATWLRSIESLYARMSVSGVPPHAKPREPSAWFHSCVRQIRMYAKQFESGPDQYAIALVSALLFKASKDANVEEPEASHRAAAYVLAERLLKTLVPVREVPSDEPQAG